MIKQENQSINIRGRLMDLKLPKVMGILNVTPDSFYSSSRKMQEDEIRSRVNRMVSEGVDIIDVGGCSTRPGFTSPSMQEEWERVNLGCKIIKEIAPDCPVSIDTFNSEIAGKAIDLWEADIINDVSGGTDPRMWELVAEKNVPYVLTHNSDEVLAETVDITPEVVTSLSHKMNQLHRLGVNDVIIDPGFGFAKTLNQNFRLFDELEELARMGYPLLVGISRKSMIFKTLGTDAEGSLAGTIALDGIALEKGANILRVHDVKEAVDTVKLFTSLKLSCHD